MTDLILADPKKTMAQHQAALRHYAKRVVLQGEILSPQEENEGISGDGPLIRFDTKRTGSGPLQRVLHDQA